MRVLITGSVGMIGRKQVEVVRAAGHTVRTFDRFPQKGPDTGEHHVGDLRDMLTMRQMVQGMDAVIHLGALPSDQHGRSDEVLSINVQGTWNILLACVEAGVPRVVFYSSINALGAVGGHREPVYTPLDDAYPRHPMSPYQLSKHLGEEACLAFTRKYGLVTLALRPTFVSSPHHYAPWHTPERAPSDQGGRNEFWAYVDVRDVVDAGLRCLTVENVTHDAFLLSADDTNSMTPSRVLKETYYPELPWHQDPDSYFADAPYRALIDCSAAKRVLGWQPQHSWRTDYPEVA